MLMHGMELATAVRHEVPVIWVINNNAALGTVWQRSQTQASAQLTLARRMDWAAFARLLGADGYSAGSVREFADALRTAVDKRRPTVIDVAGTLDFGADDPWFGASAHGTRDARVT
jgi:acetolactate synthase-1/2/3 large subunit